MFENYSYLQMEFKIKNWTNTKKHGEKNHIDIFIIYCGMYVRGDSSIG